MPERYTQKLDALHRAILETSGSADAKVRRSAFSVAGACAGHKQDIDSKLSVAWSGVVEKIATAAYKVTDGDIETLRQNGLDEDAIFEVVLAAALGAASVRLERGLAVVDAEMEA